MRIVVDESLDALAEPDFENAFASRRNFRARSQCQRVTYFLEGELVLGIHLLQRRLQRFQLLF